VRTGARVVMDFAGGKDLEFGAGVAEDPARSLADDRHAAIPPQPPPWAAALAAVAQPEPLPRAGEDFELDYILWAPSRGTVTEVGFQVQRRVRRRDGRWSKPHTARLTKADLLRLPSPEDRWALSLVHAASAYPGSYPTFGPESAALNDITYLRGPLLELLLPRLCATQRVYLRAWQQYASVPSVTEEPPQPLQWDEGDPWRLTLVVGRAGASEGDRPDADHDDAYRVDGVLERDGAELSIHGFDLLTDTFAFKDHVVARFDPAGGFAWAAQLRERGPIVIPVASKRALVESLARSSVTRVRLPEDLQWQERQVAPRFTVTISRPREGSGACAVSAMAEYEDTQVPLVAGSRAALGADGRVMYVRDLQAEAKAREVLAELGVGGAESRDGASISYRKVPALVHALVDSGWSVEAEGLRYRPITPRLRVRSGINWFDLQMTTAGDVPFDVRDLVGAVAEGRRTVRLGDGTVGMLPEEWLARVAPVFALGEAQMEGLRFTRQQVTLLDALLATQPEVDWDEGFVRARHALSRFERVRPEDPAPTFEGELREYQREALGWMRFLRDFGFGGCLADDMGLGKTVMVLAMLDARRHDPDRRHRPSLVVMPRSLVFNWKTEATRFTPALRVLDFAHAGRYEALEALGDVDVVFTTYGTLRRDVPALRAQQFDYVVLDEAQAIKNAGTATAKAVRLLQADHRLALSGTPVENHLGELHSLFDFLNPGLLGSGRLLDVRRVLSAEDAPGHAARIAKGLRPFFLRRTKEQVTPELPPRTDETLYCELEGEQKRIYEQLRQHYQRVVLDKIARDGLAKSRFQILEALLRLRQAACHTGLLPRARGGESAKFDVLMPRLAELVVEGRKALVFSQFTALLRLLRERLDADRVTYEYLDGKTRDREARVARFQSDPECPLFLISLKAGGVGLNLTAADYVFLLDPWWNPAVERQAIDRTHRIGQDKPVFAFRLVACDTVEERILELQAHKRALTDAVLDAGTGGLRGLDREELEQLLS
jgi:superfamily II DNA or RNA helicase